MFATSIDSRLLVYNFCQPSCASAHRPKYWPFLKFVSHHPLLANHSLIWLVISLTSVQYERKREWTRPESRRGGVKATRCACDEWVATNWHIRRVNAIEPAHTRNRALARGIMFVYLSHVPNKNLYDEFSWKNSFLTWSPVSTWQ